MDKRIKRNVVWLVLGLAASAAVWKWLPAAPARPTDLQRVGLQQADWTVFLYFAADWKGEDSAWASEFQRWLDVPDVPGVNIVALYDREEGAAAAIGGLKAWSNPKVVRLEGGRLTVLEDWKEEDNNMGDPSSVARFLRLADEKFPARRHIFLGAGHGNALGGTFFDLSHDAEIGSPLQTTEWRDAFGEFVKAHGRFDLCVLESCYMATVEVADALRPFTPWLVAAEMLVHTELLPIRELVTTLGSRPSVDGETLGKILVDGFHPPRPNAGNLVALLNLGESGVASLVAETSLLGDELTKLLRGGDLTVRARLEQDLTHIASLPTGGLCDGKGMRDLGQFAARLMNWPSAPVQSAAARVRDALHRTVVRVGSRGNPENLSGLSMEVDSCNVEPPCTKYGELPIAADSNWDEFLKVLETEGCTSCAEAKCAAKPSVQPRSGHSIEVSSSLVPFEPWCGAVTFVAGKGDDPEHFQALVRVPVEPKADGTLTFVWDQTYLAAGTRTGSVPLILTQSRSGEDDSGASFVDAEVRVDPNGVPVAGSPLIRLRIRSTPLPGGGWSDELIEEWSEHRGAPAARFVVWRAGDVLRTAVDPKAVAKDESNWLAEIDLLRKRSVELVAGERPEIRREDATGLWFVGFEVLFAAGRIVSPCLVDTRLPPP